MLFLHHPEILKILQDFVYGLLPIHIAEDNKHALVIKATKETLLTARANNEIKIYLIHDGKKPHTFLGIITAFFDDHDEPLMVATPLTHEDGLMKDIVSLLSMKEFDIYFFDEHNREFMGVKAINNDFERFAAQTKNARFGKINYPAPLKYMQAFMDRFSERTAQDDKDAYTITFEERLYSDDFVMMDLTVNLPGLNDSENSMNVSTLKREIDPSPMQERDIAVMMKRIFKAEEIFLNPYRTDTARELTDIMIVTNEIILLIQAKDSPNTEDSLKRSIERKKSTIRGHIQKAVYQMNGAIKYVRENDPLRITTSGVPRNISSTGKQIVGLIVVRELFDDDYQACSDPVISLINESELPIGLLDYPQLHIISRNMNTPVNFIQGLYKLVDLALEKNVFPKSVYLAPPPPMSEK